MLLKEPKILSSGVQVNWSEVVQTETNYHNKASKATVYYYLDEKAFIDGKEFVISKKIDVPYIKQEELKKSGVTAKTLAEEAVAKLEKAEAEAAIIEATKPIV